MAAMMTKLRGPWEQISTREVYRNAWIRVREDQVIRPDGQPGMYGVVEMTPAVGIVALTTDWGVHLVGQYRYATECYSWEIVAGYGADDEPALAAAQRELAEETGLTAGRWTSLGTCHVSNSVTNQIGHLLLAEDLVVGAARLDDTEDLGLKIVPLAEALELARTSGIAQTFSLVGLYRAWHYIHD